jgi:hypothetical protein
MKIDFVQDDYRLALMLKLFELSRFGKRVSAAGKWNAKMRQIRSKKKLTISDEILL